MPPSERACTSCQTPLPADAVFCPRCGVATPTQISGGGTMTVVAPSDPTVDQQRRVQAALGPDYEVRRRIGSGGFAEVWAAFDRRLQRTVAVKVLHPDLVATRAMLERFQREAQAVAKLRHPGVIPIYAVGEYEGLAYYIMPLVEGESLRERLTREGPLPPTEVRRILQETAAALAVAHEAGIVHRDLKPENLMLEGKDRRLLVMDFGIAKSMAGTQTGLTGTGMIVGTPTYMSPEQATGSKDVDVRSDIYSLGVVGFELLTGKPPFSAASVPELMLQHVSTPAPSVAAGRPDIPEDLAIAVNHCLMKEPVERWKDAGELSAFLERVATPISPPTAIPKDLRRFARGRWRTALTRLLALRPRRWHVLVFVLVGLVGGLASVGRPLISDVFEYWFPPHNAETAWQAPWENLGWGGFWVRARLTSIGDTSLLVTGSAIRPVVYNGTSWTSVPVLDSEATQGIVFEQPAFRRADSLWMVSNEGRLYLWTSAGLRYRDSLGFSVSETWSDGRDVVLGTADGGIVRGSASGWRREPTGAAGRTDHVWGRDAQHLYAAFEWSMPFGRDSLLAYDGFRWNGITPAPGFSASFWSGVTLEDGTTLVLGTGNKRRYSHGQEVMPEGGSPPLVMRGDSLGSTWRAVDLGFLRSELPLGAWGRSVNDFYAWGQQGWGGFANCTGSCLVRVVHGQPVRVTDVPHVPVVGVSSLRGLPYVLFEDGSLWASRDGHWRLATTLPRSQFVDVAVNRTLGPIAVSDRVLVSRGAINEVDPDAGTIRRVVAADSMAWVLTDRGEVRLAACHVLRPASAIGPVSCTFPPILSPGHRRINDVSADARGHLLGVGDAGLIVSWTSGPASIDAVPVGARQDTLVRVLIPDSGAPVAIGRRFILRRDRPGHWRLARRLARAIQSVHDAAILTDGRIVVAVTTGAGEHQIVVLGADSSSDFALPGMLRSSDSPERLLALPDQKLAIAYAHRNDPSVGGWLGVVNLGSGRRAVSMWRVDPPHSADLYGIARDSTFLYAVGGGWLAMKIRLDALLSWQPHQNRISYFVSAP